MPGPSTDRLEASERAAAFVEAAHRYAELRWALIRAEGKRPKGEAWQDTKPEAPELAAGKWSRWGERYNLGVVCGPSGLAILDVDRDDDADRAALDLLGTDDLPATPTVRTGRGSRLQLYFADPGGLEKHARDGFELRVGPHQCLAPPSVHPETGRAYAWLPARAPWEVALAPLPETLIRYFAKERRNGSGPTVAPMRGETTAYGRAALEAEAHAVASAAEGSRNITLNNAALKLGSLVAGGELDEAEALAALEAAAAACGLPEKEAKATIESGLGAGLRQPRPRPATSSRPRPQVTSSLVPTPSGGDEVEHLVPDLVPKPHSWQAVDLVARAARPPEPPDIIGLFYVGYFHLLSGESEALKTWLAGVAAADELRAGHGVLWIDGDDVGAGAVLERLRLLGADDESIAARFAYVVPDEPLDQDKLPDVLAAATERACRLAVLDGFNPLLGLHGLDPNSGTDVELFYRLIDPIRKLGIATVLTDNVVKAREARGAWAIGSERKKSKAEVHLGMKTLEPLVRGGRGRAKIDVHKDRPGHLERPSPGILVLENTPTGIAWRIEPDESRGAEGEFRPTNLMEKVSRLLELHSEPQSRNQIESAKLGKAEYVRVALSRLVEEGFASEFSGARGARLVRLERAFRESEEGEQP